MRETAGQWLHSMESKAAIVSASVALFSDCVHMRCPSEPKTQPEQLLDPKTRTPRTCGTGTSTSASPTITPSRGARTFDQMRMRPGSPPCASKCSVSHPRPCDRLVSS